MVEYSFGNLTWGEFKKHVEKKLRDQGCEEVDSVKIEGIDVNKPEAFKNEAFISYYEPGNSFYIVS